MPFKCNLSLNKHEIAFSMGSKLIVLIKRHFYCMEAGECEFNRNCIYAKWVWIKFLFGKHIFVPSPYILSPLHNTISIFSIWYFCVDLENVLFCVFMQYARKIRSNITKSKTTSSLRRTFFLVMFSQ